MPRSASFRLPQPQFDEPTFAEGVPTPDPTRFTVPHPSDAQQYQQIQALLYEDAVAFPPSRGSPADLYTLSAALGAHGPEMVQAIQAAGHIVFHTVGDIGASSQAKYPGELRVSDQVTIDCHSSPPADRPAFLYLLGDLIYDFGEAQYYYDQFYEPYRNYPAPIFAIPGNHDSFVVPGTAAATDPLATFQRNFCATEPVVTAEAGSLHRTAMTQPGVYFALDAPFVRVIGLFSNALEDPGVISSQNGAWKAVPDLQLAFLTAQLQQVKSGGYSGAVVLAVHHPPFSYAPPANSAGAGGIHGGSPAMLAQIDAICQAVGVYPHAVLAGHAHNYQRYTRTIPFGSGSFEVPFIVAGGGGHDVSPLVSARGGSAAADPAPGTDVTYLDSSSIFTGTRLVLDRTDDHDYGYLRVSVDAQRLSLSFFPVGSAAAGGTAADTVVVDLASHTVDSTSPSPARTRRPRTMDRGRAPRGRLHPRAQSGR